MPEGHPKVVDLWQLGLRSEGEVGGRPLLLRGRTDHLADRYSERNERQIKAVNAAIQKI